MGNNYKIIKEKLKSGKERFLLLSDRGRFTPIITLGVIKRYVMLRDFNTKKEALNCIKEIDNMKVIKQTQVLDTQDSQKVKE